MQKADKGEKPPSETQNCYVENNQSGTVAPVREAFQEAIFSLWYTDLPLTKSCTAACTYICPQCQKKPQRTDMNLSVSLFCFFTCSQRADRYTAVFQLYSHYLFSLLCMLVLCTNRCHKLHNQRL